jgi:hypothetical protein
MNAKSMNKPPIKGRQLLNVLVTQIRAGRIKSGNPGTFIPYSEALAALGHRKTHLFAGKRLQYAGLNDLNEWTKTIPGIPHVAGLIVNKRSREPSDGYPDSHGKTTSNAGWKTWWLAETTKAIKFNWMLKCAAGEGELL